MLQYFFSSSDITNGDRSRCFLNQTGRILLWAVLMGVLLGLSLHAYATGIDVLQGTTNDARATMQGSGKRWLYLIEGVTALGAYIKTKNIFVLGGVAVVALFLNIVLQLSGS